MEYDVKKDVFNGRAEMAKIKKFYQPVQDGVEISDKNAIQDGVEISDKNAIWLRNDMVFSFKKIRVMVGKSFDFVDCFEVKTLFSEKIIYVMSTEEAMIEWLEEAER